MIRRHDGITPADSEWVIGMNYMSEPVRFLYP